MDLSFWWEFFRVAIILVAVTQILDLATARFPVRDAPLRQQIVAGVVTGLGAIAVMSLPFVLSPGVIFDPRSVLLSVAALFFGTVTAVVAMLVSAAFRISMGGPGALTGVLVIGASIVIGLLWRRRVAPDLERVGWRELLALGVIVHIVMLALMLTLPDGRARTVLPQISLPVLLLFPLATIALGKLMGLRLDRERRFALLEQSEARYRTLFEQKTAAVEALHLRSAALEAADNAIMITDSGGAIQWVNRAFTRLYGYSLDDSMGRNPRELMKSDAHDAEFFRDLWQTILAGRPWRGRIVNRRADGTVFEEDMAITAIRASGGDITHFIAVKQDLTSWRAMEQRLALGAKLETVGRLAGGVAHDFNNILTIINGALDMALEDLPGDHTSRGDIVVARTAGERASALTRQLLAFGRRQVQLNQPLNLNDVASGMMSMLLRLIGDGIRLDLQLADDLDPVLADPGQMEQVLLNLVLNARDAMPGGGTVTVITRNGAKGTVELVVRDGGHGMAPDVQARIFDPFFTTKASGDGAGLGLPTVYGIVTQSGGTIRVTSHPGQGAEFCISLPRTVLTPAAATAADIADGAFEPAVVLVVEDDDTIRDLATRILERRGYTVLTSAGGPHALDLARTHGGAIDLLFTDVVMPDMSGPELARAMLRARPGIRVMFTSGYTDESLSRHGVHETGHAFLEKPYSVEGLVAAVRGALGNPQQA